MSDQDHRRGLPAELRPLLGDEHGDRELPVSLPAGSLVAPNPNFLERQVPIQPAYWLSDDAVDEDLWPRLRAAHSRSGLWPVLVDDSIQSWSLGQIMPEPPGQIDNYNVTAFMREVWAEQTRSSTHAEEPVDYPELEPYGRRSPGPAPAGRPRRSPDEVSDQLARALNAGKTPLALAPATRGADALAVMGWQGAVNHNQWIAPLAAVVRSWEDRFGARVVRIGFNTLDLSIAAPPETAEHALNVAAEHWAFCPDIIYQGPGSLAAYADQIGGANRWSFWWD